MTKNAMTVRDEALAWIAQDPDQETRDELTRLLDDDAALSERFAGQLTFGTAGLRGELGAGPARMNRVTVGRAAAGFAAWLLARGGEQSVVIGYDGRKNSAIFARDTAELMHAAGVRATLLPRALPTPVLAFAVRHLDMSAGVMVTASHNPANDNGYKVYLGGTDGGSQIVSPVDGQIEAAIRAVGPIDALDRSDAFEIAAESVVDAYVAATATLGTTHPSPRFVYTPMHGVGLETARAAFAASGLGEPIVVQEQAEPDPTFPTVPFPNPEEPGALDLAIALAARVDAELVVANDPDADRLAIAIPSASGWRNLSGNEVGALLGWHVAAHGATDTLACSIVSSPALAAIAADYGLRHEETLTGFKWISRVPNLAFGFEEALGYLVDPLKVRDKDGISAAVAFLSLYAGLAADGVTLAEHQRAFDERFGAFASAQVSIRVTDLSVIGQTMARLRATPPSFVTATDDFMTGIADFAPSNILRFHAGDTARVIVRPSGTEPKLKAYIDTWSSTGTAIERRAAADSALVELTAAVREAVGA
jgi:phosphomannomutase